MDIPILFEGPVEYNWRIFGVMEPTHVVETMLWAYLLFIQDY